MPSLDSQPEMVGREHELRELQGRLDKAAEGHGSTLFVAGEAGIGKTKLLDELKDVARSKGFQILSGNSLYESLTPYMPFMEALRSGGLESLFAEEAPRVEGAYLMTDTGLLIDEILREETGLDPELFASMLTTVGNFVKDSLSMLEGAEKKGTLNTLGYEEYRILIESGQETNLAVMMTGRENEFLINYMDDILVDVHKQFGDILKDWDGDEEGVQGIGTILRPLIASGRFDGVYYGKEDSKARRNLLFENVSMGLTRQTKLTPTLLCLEDLQWADPSSLALMHYVARNTRECNLLILGTYRPEDVAAKEGEHPLIDTMQLMSREDLYERINLQRLPEESMTDFLSSILGKTDLSDEFLNRIYGETEGNPLFIMELVKLMVEEGVVRNIKGTWMLAKAPEEVDIPSKIYDVIVRRLGRVKEEHREVLDYASVIGEVVTSETLTDVMRIERVQLLEGLRTLEKNHRLVRSFNGSYKFDHAKVKEVLYNEIPQELRMEYHSIIAQAIESANEGNLEDVIEDLAFHYHRCKSEAKALHYLIRAAEKAKKEYSNEEAIRFYIEALEYDEDRGKKGGVFEVLGEIYHLIGNHASAKESLAKALELAEGEREKARLGCLLAQAFKDMGEYEDAIQVGNDALDLVRGEECREEATALNVLGTVHVNKGMYDRALEYLRKSREIRMRIGHKKGVAASHNNIGIVCYYSGEYDKALEHWRTSRGIWEEIGDESSIPDGHANEGVAYAAKGEYDKALDHMKRALESKEKMGALANIVSQLGNIGNVLSEQGDYDAALDYFEKSLNIARKLGDQRSIALASANTGRLQLLMGEYDKALENLERSLEIREKTHDLGSATYLYCDIASVYLETGDFTGALHYCSRAFDLANEIDVKENIGCSRRIFGKIYGRQEKWEESVENFEESIRILGEIGRTRDLGEVHYEFGLMWRAKGDADKAEEHLNKALEIYENLGLDRLIGRVKEALADLAMTEPNRQKPAHRDSSL